MKKLVMERVFNTDCQFNIEDERWLAWHDWLAGDGHALMDHALAMGIGDTIINTGNTCLEINVLLLDDAQMQAINRDYRGKDKPTNVLSFPQIESTDELQAALTHADDHDEEQKKPFLLGDIVLSYETIQKQAENASKPMRDHLGHMLVHAILHLLGYDHEHAHEAQIMESLEGDILEAYGIKNPYTLHGAMAY